MAADGATPDAQQTFMSGISRSPEPVPQRPHRALKIVALLMILFGSAEVVTGFSHNFFGVYIARTSAAAHAGAAIGGLYATAGLLILTMKRTAAALALVLLAVVVGGRIGMAMTGLYPTGSVKQVAAIAVGTAIAVAFAVYIRLRWTVFR
jgi:hypothetical protein